MARILLIDDDDLFVKALSTLFTRDGHQTEQAKNGKEGIKLFGGAPFDVVVTDILMPEKEGIETIMELRVLSSSVFIVAMSGGGQNSPVDLLEFARKLGANVALRKPFSFAQLRQLIAASQGAEPAD